MQLLNRCESGSTTRSLGDRSTSATGQALVEIRGHRTYLGKYDSPRSHEQYRQIIAELMSVSRGVAKRTEPLRVDELILLYFEFAKGYYVKYGQLTNELVAIRASLHGNEDYTDRHRRMTLDQRHLSLLGNR